MAYAILRVAKLKTMGNVGGHGSHVERQRETLNADPEKLALNQRLAGSDDPVYDVKVRFDEAGVEPRKGAVVAIDVFISASPEHFARNHPDDPNWKAFQAKAMAFLCAEYGAANVVHAMAHHDETTPHIHAIVTPIRSKTVKVGRKVKTERVENRLCAKDWLGGDRSTLSKLQTRFAKSVKELGLERGIEGSKAKHTEVNQFYAVMKETVSQAQRIHTTLAPIQPDYFVKSVPKPSLLDIAQPRKFAQLQVQHAMASMNQLIRQTNHNTELARTNQLAKLQTPVTDALIQKGNTRQSQAEKALEKLGYRLDQHGGLVNILEERKNAFRASIAHSVKRSTSFEELRADMARKGIKIGLYKQHQQTYQGEKYNGVGFDDGKGTIWGHELGNDYTTIALVQQLNQQAIQREKEKREKQYQTVLDGWLASLFKDCKGDAGKMQHQLATMTPQQRETIDKHFQEQYGQEGATYAKQQLDRLSKLSSYELASERERLRQGGYDLGKGLGRGPSL